MQFESIDRILKVVSYSLVQYFNLNRVVFFHVIISSCSQLKVETLISLFKADNAVVITICQYCVHLVITYLSIPFLLLKIECTWSVFWTCKECILNQVAN